MAARGRFILARTCSAVRSFAATGSSRWPSPTRRLAMPTWRPRALDPRIDDEVKKAGFTPDPRAKPAAVAYSAADPAEQAGAFL